MRAATHRGPEPRAGRRFAAALAAMGLPDGPLVVAVSGGGDSVALMHLLAARPALRHRLTAVTVDHGLRPEAAAEAAQVAAWAGSLGIPHRTVAGSADNRPASASPRGGLQAAARAMRYRLLAGASAAAGGAAILLAHTLDDQAETVLMRRLHGSGPAGLGGMSPVTRRRDLAGAPLILRPLLDLERAELREWLRWHGHPWLEDPSNADMRFERVRIRRMLPDRAARLRLAEDGKASRYAAATLDRSAGRALAQALTLSPHGDDRLAVAPLAAAGAEVACHALRGLLAALGTGDYPPQRAAVARLWEVLSTGRPGATLAGCRLRRIGTGQYLVLRDRRHPLPALPLAPGTTGLWGQRHMVRVPCGGPATLPDLRELGPVGTGRVRRALGPGPEAAALAALPPEARPGVPALFRGERLVALPTLREDDGRGGEEALSASSIGLQRQPCRPFRPWRWETLAAMAAAADDAGIGPS